MFSNRFYKLFGLAISASSFCGGVPFSWNFKERKLYANSSTIAWFLLHATMVYTATAYLGLRVLYEKKLGLGNISFLVSLFIAALLDSCFYTILLLDPRHTAVTLDATLTYLEDFSKKWRLPHPQLKKLLRYLFYYTMLKTSATAVAPIWISGHYFLFPNDPAYLCSVSALQPLCDSITFYLIFGAFYIWMLYSIWMNIGCGLLFMELYTFTLYQVMDKELVLGCKKGYTTKEALRQVENLCLEYRTIEILHKNVNQVIEPLIIPAQSVIMQFSLFCNYVLIKNWKDLDSATISILLLWTTVSCFGWMVALYAGGYIYFQGTKVTRSWKSSGEAMVNKGDRKYLSKFRKSCRPLGIRAGNYFCMKKLSLLRFLRGIVRGTFRALLTIKK